MAAINAYRMDGLGNDFIIIDRREKSIEIKKSKIIELGKRANIGFDQIIFIEKQKEISYPITIYNSDGGEVSACGNGARCVAYLLSENLNTKKIQIKTNNRLLNAKIVGDFQVELEMGKPLFGSEEIPLSKKINPSNVVLDINDQTFSEGFCVNVGNPHIIFFDKDYYCYMTGFIAGMPFLGDIEESIRLKRLETPRVKVPKGAVGITEQFCNIYTFESPGGWNILGNTPLKIFDKSKKSNPSLVKPGDTVQFYKISKKEYLNWNE